MSQSTRYASTVSTTAKGLVSTLGLLAQKSAAVSAASTRAAEEAGKKMAPWSREFSAELKRLAESGDRSAKRLAKQPAAFYVLCDQLQMPTFPSVQQVSEKLALVDDAERTRLLEHSMSVAGEASENLIRQACSEVLDECGYVIRKSNNSTQIFTAANRTTVRVDVQKKRDSCSVALDLSGFAGMRCTEVRRLIEDKLRRRGVELRIVTQHSNGCDLPEKVSTALGIADRSTS